MRTAIFSVKWSPLLYHQYRVIWRNLFMEERSKQKRCFYLGLISSYPGQHQDSTRCLVTQRGCTVTKLSEELCDAICVLPHLHLEATDAIKLSSQRNESIRLSFIVMEWLFPLQQSRVWATLRSSFAAAYTKQQERRWAGSEKYTYRLSFSLRNFNTTFQCAPVIKFCILHMNHSRIQVKHLQRRAIYCFSKLQWNEIMIKIHFNEFIVKILTFTCPFSLAPLETKPWKSRG